jgi:hypothetical protein
MQTTKINPNRFLRNWLLYAIVVWPVVGIACLVLWSPFALFLTMLGGYSAFSWLSEIASLLSLLIMPSLVIGFFVGNFQSTLLGDELAWEIESWQRHTIFGAIFGGILVILSSFLGFGNNFAQPWFPIMPLFVLGLSSVQWFSLRHESRDAWLWILGNLTGGLVFSSLLLLNQGQNVAALDSIVLTAWWLLAVTAQGLITGIVMLYLYERPIQEEGRELAPVYIEVRNRDQR